MLEEKTLVEQVAATVEDADVVRDAVREVAIFAKRPPIPLPGALVLSLGIVCGAAMRNLGGRYRR